MYGKKMMELRQNQKADVVLLKQELDYCTTGCLLHIYVCTGDCMALSIRRYEWK